jgi:hypothetical protein
VAGGELAAGPVGSAGRPDSVFILFFFFYNEIGNIF